MLAGIILNTQEQSLQQALNSKSRWKTFRKGSNSCTSVRIYPVRIRSEDAATMVQWPALLRPRSPIMGKMPPMVIQRYNACQTICFCGVFPEIKRAWASVDNSLYLWRYDKW